MKEATTGATGAGETTRARPGKYLTFRLQSEEYGIEILKVQEIIKMMDITRVPRTPEFVRGVVNLRGKVIPVIDLRLKFSMPAKEATEKTCIVVVQARRENGTTVTMGVIVDEVSEVLDISADQLEPAPEFGTAIDTGFLLGMGKVAKAVIMLLDADKVLNTGELAEIAKVA